MKCRSCLADVPADATHCPACGAEFRPSSVLSVHVGGEGAAPIAPEPTASEPADPAVGRGTPQTASSLSASRSASSLSNSRFPPGALVDGRYRILGPIGAGGMGEVFRAEDERLGMLVALKFLPQAATDDATLRERLLEEVRTARAVTHPNVCRVHDVGEAEGQLYLSMELVDGEDLGSLLKRIGRLPAAKATELARQLCAGLAAAHARGILHRDLKPANVMVDGEGRARITDFGLAIVGEASGAEALAGTPLYMSPEQLEGREATARSDVYSLGLVLYELLTGERPHAGQGVEELARARRANQAAPPSTIVRDLDPAFERVIERCLEPDARARPASALVVAAGLPGAESLESRLAAGETPSPELIAAAGGVGALRPAQAAALAALVVVLGLAILATNPGVFLIGYEDLPLAPEVLEHQARELLGELGFQEPTDSAFGIGRNGTYLQHLASLSTEADRWDPLREVDVPSSVVFWYRQHDGRLDPIDDGGSVTFDDPPRTRPGMATVILSPRGKLLHLEAVAPWEFDPEREGATVDWAPLFRAAGLDLDAPPFPLEEAEPTGVPRTPFDEVHAWSTRHPGAPDLPLRVLAAGFQGRPIQFVLDWDPAPVTGEAQAGQTLADGIGELVQLVCLVGAIVLAWRSWRSGRADRRGAMRLAGIVFVSFLGAWAARFHVVAEAPYVIQSLFEAAEVAAFVALLVWAMYLALERLVRSIWPRCLVAWSRLLSGGWRDPLVAREVLAGMAFGSAAVLVQRAARFAAPEFGRPPMEPDPVRWPSMLSLRGVVGEVLVSIPAGLMMGFGLVLLLVILRGVLRSRRLAIGALCAVMFFTAPIEVTSIGWLDFTQSTVLTALFLLAMLRCGVLTMAVGAAWLRIAIRMPATFEFGTWYGHAGMAFLAMVVGAALYGYRVASPPWAAKARG